MSTIATYAPISAGALAAGDTILSPFGFEGLVTSVVESDESHGPIKHWHVVVESDAGGMLPAVLPAELVVGEEDVLMVRVWLDEEVTPEGIINGL